jgi:hypothetical protein
MKIDLVKKITEELLEYLPSKNKNILKARFGLDDEKPRTLEFIGGKLNITRERVRQIEVASFKRLRDIKKSDNINKLLNKIELALTRNGGVLDFAGFRKAIFGKSKISLVQENQLKLIINSDLRIRYNKGDSKLGDLWYLSENKKEILALKSVHQKLVNYFKETKQVLTFEQIINILRGDNFYKKKEESVFVNGEYFEKKVKTTLRNSGLIKKNILNQWGLASWRLINPTGVREKAYLVYQKYEKPLHFREVTKLINRHFKDGKIVIPETVCNVVIYFKEFIAVESGTYGLVEWKLFDNKLKEDLKLFLGQVDSNSNQGRFVTIDEIIAHISEKNKKNIKDYVIQANLFDKKIFTRRGYSYALKEDI